MISRTLAHTALSLFLTTALTAPLAAQESASAETEEVAAVSDGWNPADWELEDSEFTPEAGWTFGKLDNGMRYIIRRNDRPEGTALVRMIIKTGSIDERDEERGFAHYVEHMVFNGSTNIPEGEMIKLLEREGLAFGADTNASTGFDRTEYKLNLPRTNPELMGTALMLMRETASELTIAPEAVERERGVILSERRVRNSYAFKNVVDSLDFAFPGARLPNRLPIGTIETLEGATAEALRDYWEREYVPADTVMIVVGDFDPQMVESEIRARFSDWAASESPKQPRPGPVDPEDKGRTGIYLDPALTESIAIMRHAPYVDRADTVGQRRKNVLLQIGQSILGRRLQRLLRSENPPFRGANASTSDFFEDARTTTLSIASEEGQWQAGLDAAVDEYRRVLQYGVTEAEVAEQISNRQTAFENALANARTRSNGAFVGQATTIARGDSVPDSPAKQLERFNAVAAIASPEAVLGEMRANAIDLDQPLIRFAGKTAPVGGADSLRAAVKIAFQRDVAPPQDTVAAAFAYTDFGPAGEIVSDTITANYDIRTLRFANGVMLNLKPTDLEDDQISIRVSIDGGRMLNTRENPMANSLTSLLTSGGLGKHSQDELQSVLAGRSVGGSFSAGSDRFTSGAGTTPRDLELQMQLLAAYITDPGYRAEGLGPWRKSLVDFYARIGKTPGSAYGEVQYPRLTDDDPRFTREPIEAYQALDYSHLQRNISERLTNGAIEIAIVGDFEEDETIAYVAKTFGALPQREAVFRPYDDGRRSLTVTSDRAATTITHDGEPDQAMVSYVWPTTDDSDWVIASQFNLLSRVVRLMLTEKLREELGQTYSPSVNSSLSSSFDDFGTFSMSASVDVAQVAATKTALDEVIAALLEKAPDEDLIQRARQPVYESLDNRLKSNGSWMSIVDRAQSEPEDLDRFKTTRERYETMTGDDLLALARKYLQPDQAIQFTVMPSETALAKTPTQKPATDAE